MFRNIATAALAGTVLLVSGLSTASAEHPLRPEDLPIPVDQSILDRQQDALSKITAAELKRSEIGLLRVLRGRTGIRVKHHNTLKKGDSGAEILKQLAPLLLAKGDEILTVSKNRSVDRTLRRIDLAQTIDGMPAIDGSVMLLVDDMSGEIEYIGSGFIPNRGLPKKPKLTSEQAESKAIEHLEIAEWAEHGTVQLHGEPHLAYWAGGDTKRKPALVWVVGVSFTAVRGGDRDFNAYMDAIDGEFRGAGGGSSHFSAYTANGVASSVSNFPSGLAAVSPSSSALVQTAYNHALDAHDTWLHEYLDGPSNVGVVVDWGRTTPQARHYWNGGTHWIAFSGPAGGRQPYSNSRDTVAHEYGHGVHKTHTQASTLNEESGNIAEGYVGLWGPDLDYWTLRSVTNSASKIQLSKPGTGVRLLVYMRACNAMGCGPHSNYERVWHTCGG